MGLCKRRDRVASRVYLRWRADNCFAAVAVTQCTVNSDVSAIIVTGPEPRIVAPDQLSRWDVRVTTVVASAHIANTNILLLKTIDDARPRGGSSNESVWAMATVFAGEPVNNHHTVVSITIRVGRGVKPSRSLN